MILNCGAIYLKKRLSTVCLASPSTTAEQLRQQLDNLHKEAETTRAKANNARLRLMRLSEAAEKLRRQAAVNVQTGKEDDARELLFQKKKVMQAMEKLKNRIELFDELAAKLNGAVSMKEDLLIGNMALDLDVTETELPSPVRVVSPVEEVPSISDDSQNLDPDHLLSGENQDLQVFDKSQLDIHAENEENNQEMSLSRNTWSGVNNLQSLRGNSPYKDFMKNLDQDLKKIEEELEAFLRFSTLLIDSKEKPKYSKVQHVTEILEGVHQTRERISNILQTTMSSIEE